MHVRIVRSIYVPIDVIVDQTFYCSTTGLYNYVLKLTMFLLKSACYTSSQMVIKRLLRPCLGFHMPLRCHGI